MSLAVSALSPGDLRYPTALAAIHDPPSTLWVKGHADALRAPAVAIVGSRAASPYALEVARRLGADLARRGVTVVSGMARGVDSAAHRGALDGDGITIAVLGCGAGHRLSARARRAGRTHLRTRRAHQRVSRGHATIQRKLSAAQPHHQRLVAGVVVVEAAEGSGSLITADFALEQGRAVLAVPGNVLGGRNYGAHALLRDGAKLVECADDILEELPPLGIRDWGLGIRESKESNKVNLASQDPVLRRMTEGESYDLDELSHLSGLDRVRLLPRLLELELGGAVRRIEGGRFVRFRGPC